MTHCRAITEPKRDHIDSVCGMQAVPKPVAGHCSQKNKAAACRKLFKKMYSKLKGRLVECLSTDNPYPGWHDVSPCRATWSHCCSGLAREGPTCPPLSSSQEKQPAAGSSAPAMSPVDCLDGSPNTTESLSQDLHKYQSTWLIKQQAECGNALCPTPETAATQPWMRLVKCRVLYPPLG